MKNLITILKLQVAFLLCLSIFACGNGLSAWPHGMLATGSEPGEYYFTANPFTSSLYDHYLYHITGYNASFTMPFGMETTLGAWYDRCLDLSILVRNIEDSIYTFSWDGGITFELGPEIYYHTFEVSFSPGESFFASAWSRDTLSTWEIGACIGRPSSGSTYERQCAAWNPGQAMSIYWFNSTPDSHYIYHSYDYADYYTLTAVTAELPGCVYLTRGVSPGEMYSIYGGNIYRTTDYGQTWEWACQLYYGPSIFIEVFLESGWAPGELIIMYWQHFIEPMVDIYRSTDYGSTWELLWETAQLSVDDGNVPPAPSSFELSVWPNPTNGSIRLQLPSSTDGYLSVYDILGRKVIEKSIESRTQNLMLDMGSLTSGTYLLRLKTDTNIDLTQKVILIK